MAVRIDLELLNRVREIAVRERRSITQQLAILVERGLVLEHGLRQDEDEDSARVRAGR